MQPLSHERDYVWQCRILKTFQRGSAGCRVFVGVGDLMLDRYLWGGVERAFVDSGPPSEISDAVVFV